MTRKRGNRARLDELDPETVSDTEPEEKVEAKTEVESATGDLATLVVNHMTVQSGVDPAEAHDAAVAAIADFCAGEIKTLPRSRDLLCRLNPDLRNRTCNAIRDGLYLHAKSFAQNMQRVQPSVKRKPIELEQTDEAVTVPDA